MRPARAAPAAFVLLAAGALLSAAPAASADDRCCAGHGGPAACDGALGRMVCADGSLSKRCRCPRGRSGKIRRRGPRRRVLRLPRHDKAGQVIMPAPPADQKK